MHLLKAEAVIRRHKGISGKLRLCLAAAEALQLFRSDPELVLDVACRERIKVITPCHETGKSRGIAVIAHMSVRRDLCMHSAEIRKVYDLGI